MAFPAAGIGLTCWQYQLGYRLANVCLNLASPMQAADPNSDVMMADGLVRFCEDLGVDPSDIVMVRTCGRPGLAAAALAGCKCSGGHLQPPLPVVPQQRCRGLTPATCTSMNRKAGTLQVAPGTILSGCGSWTSLLKRAVGRAAERPAWWNGHDAWPRGSKGPGLPVLLGQTASMHMSDFPSS
eukprot:356907-Chlamydomonas_euryale.AAC.3